MALSLRDVWQRGTPTYSNVRTGHGCRYCVEPGVDWDGPTLVYLLHHERYGAHKVGIAKQGSNRTQMLAGDGWETFRTFVFLTGDDAYRVEQAVLVRIARRSCARTSAQPRCRPPVIPRRLTLKR